MLLTMDREKYGNYYHTTLVNSTAYRAIDGVANVRSMLEHGFTTIRDLGNNAYYGDADLRRAIEAGVVPGPTMLNAGRIIAPFGGQLQLQPERPDLAEPEYFFADTKDELSLSYIDTYVETGLPPKYILQMLTTNGAKLLGVENERGKIAKGYAADLIAMPEKPLDDILTLKKVYFVMKDGKVFRHETRE
ncbi:MAG: amidohydrolase family protein [bacterium]